MTDPNDSLPSDDPLEEAPAASPALEPSTLRGIKAIKSVDPKALERIEWHVGNLVLDDCIAFLDRVAQLPKPYRRAAIFRAVEETRRMLMELGEACQFFEAGETS